MRHGLNSGRARRFQVRQVLTSAAMERQEAKVEKANVARTLEDERRMFEQSVLDKVNGTIDEVRRSARGAATCCACLHDCLLLVDDVVDHATTSLTIDCAGRGFSGSRLE